jgi:hypothetical protein
MMQFVLTGFTQDGEYRVFSFDGIGPDRVRSAFTVRIDLGLSRRYGIRFQELPLLCRGVLDRGGEASPSRAMTFTERDMDQHAKDSAARAAATQKRTFPRRPSGSNQGAAWRTSQAGVANGSTPASEQRKDNGGKGGE